VGDVRRGAPLGGSSFEQAVELLHLGLEQAIQHSARCLSKLRLAEGLWISGDAFVDEMRVRVDRAEDRIERCCGGENQGNLARP